MARKTSMHLSASLNKDTFSDMEKARAITKTTRSAFIERALLEYFGNHNLSDGISQISEGISKYSPSADPRNKFVGLYDEQSKITKDVEDLQKQVESLNKDVRELRGMIISILQSRQDE